jgi:periplasmic protein TonB
MLQRFILFVAFSLISYLSYAQKDTTIYEFREEQPSFPGGEDSLQRYLNAETSREFAKITNETGSDINGRIYVEYVVERTGEVSNVKVVRGLHPALDSIFVKVVSGMPKWKPGSQNGMPVRVKYTVPIKVFWPAANAAQGKDKLKTRKKLDIESRIALEYYFPSPAAFKLVQPGLSFSFLFKMKSQWSAGLAGFINELKSDTVLKTEQVLFEKNTRISRSNVALELATPSLYKHKKINIRLYGHLGLTVNAVYHHSTKESIYRKNGLGVGLGIENNFVFFENTKNTHFVSIRVGTQYSTLPPAELIGNYFHYVSFGYSFREKQ